MTDRLVVAHQLDVSFVDGKSFVSIEGQNLPGVTKVEVVFDALHIPYVAVYFSLTDVHISGDKLPVEIQHALSDSLKRAGWTPPPD